MDNLLQDGLGEFRLEVWQIQDAFGAEGLTVVRWLKPTGYTRPTKVVVGGTPGQL